MPIYEYQCTDCGTKFEELVRSDTELVPCPNCKSENVLRVISLVSSKGLTSGCSTCAPTSCSSRFT